MNRGDVYLADLEPVRGSEANKIRPVILVGNRASLDHGPQPGRRIHGNCDLLVSEIRLVGKRDGRVGRAVPHGGAMAIGSRGHRAAPGPDHGRTKMGDGHDF